MFLLLCRSFAVKGSVVNGYGVAHMMSTEKNKGEPIYGGETPREPGSDATRHHDECDVSMYDFF